LQYFRGRSLLLQSFAGFGEEPRILHRDYGLRREVLQERDLLVRKRPDLAPEHDDSPEERVLYAQRYTQASTNAYQFEAVTGDLIVAIGRRLPHVTDVHDPLAVDHRIKQTKNADRTEMLHLFDNAGIAA
jgi:hypothetical protein